jgi:uncharacterized protein YaaW (UPF0174 family)
MTEFVKVPPADDSDNTSIASNSSKDLIPYGSPPLPLIEDDPDLVPLLRQASNEELAPLVKYITEKGGFSSDLQNTQCYIQNSPDHRMYADDIAAELQRFGANTIATRLRKGRGRTYRAILIDAARKSDIRARQKDKTEDIELRIIHAFLGRAWQKMPERQHQELIDSIRVEPSSGVKAAGATGSFQALVQAGGFGPYELAVIAANGVAKLLLGHGLSLPANAALTKSLSIFAGPLGIVFSALWLGLLAAGPAYRVIMPCILQVALIRQAALVRERAAKRRERLWYLIALGALSFMLLVLGFFWITEH